MNRPRSAVAQVLQALRDAGYDGPDPVFTADWLPLFSPAARQLRWRHAFAPTSGALEQSDSRGAAAESV
jgi:hypothetical protein